MLRENPIKQGHSAVLSYAEETINVQCEDPEISDVLRNVEAYLFI